jgi:hypothetical protein
MASPTIRATTANGLSLRASPRRLGLASYGFPNWVTQIQLRLASPSAPKSAAIGRIAEIPIWRKGFPVAAPSSRRARRAATIFHLLINVGPTPTMTKAITIARSLTTARRLGLFLIGPTLIQDGAAATMQKATTTLPLPTRKGLPVSRPPQISTGPHRLIQSRPKQKRLSLLQSQKQKRL